MLTSMYARHMHSHLIFTNTFEIVVISFSILQMIKLSHSTLAQTLQLANGGTELKQVPELGNTM